MKTDDELLADARALDEAYADATGPAEAYEKDVVGMLDALKVLVLTPHIMDYLIANDPKALEQARSAIDAFEPWMENADGDDPRANGWVDDRGRP